jgi:hypothetical protein
MSPTNLLRGTTAVLLVLAVVPLVAFLAVGFLIPIALLVGSLVSGRRRPRVAAGLTAAGAALLGGGVLWAGWILGVVINGDGVPGGWDLAMAVAIPLVSTACLIAAARVWRTAGRAAVTA